MELFLQQLQRLPTVWLPFILALALAAAFVWRVAERLHQTTKDAHDVNKQILESRIELLQAQLNHLERNASVNAHTPIQQQSLLASSVLRYEIEEPSVSSRVYVPDSVSPAIIFREMSASTSLQSHARLQPYIGKWLIVTGLIADILEPYHNGSVSIYVRSDEMGEPILSDYIISDVIATFNILPVELEVARKLDRICVAGVIGKSQIGSLLLENCELISVQTP